jgi:hypothetical protein
VRNCRQLDADKFEIVNYADFNAKLQKAVNELVRPILTPSMPSIQVLPFYYLEREKCWTSLCIMGGRSVFTQKLQKTKRHPTHLLCEHCFPPLCYVNITVSKAPYHDTSFLVCHDSPQLENCNHSSYPYKDCQMKHSSSVMSTYLHFPPTQGNDRYAKEKCYVKHAFISTLLEWSKHRFFKGFFVFEKM